MKTTPENHFEIGAVKIAVEGLPPAHVTEYQVRPITRYIVTRYSESPGRGGVDDNGGAEYGNYETAFQVATALAVRDEVMSDLAEGEK